MTERKSRYIDQLPGKWTALCKEEVFEILRLRPTLNELAIYLYLASIRMPDFAIANDALPRAKAGYRTIEKYAPIPKSSIGRAVRSMEKKGLIHRECSPHTTFVSISTYTFPCLEMVCSSDYRCSAAITPTGTKEDGQNPVEKVLVRRQRTPRYSVATTGDGQQRTPGVASSVHPVSQNCGNLGHTKINNTNNTNSLHEESDLSTDSALNQTCPSCGHGKALVRNDGKPLCAKCFKEL
jgi:hypothetical protein